jgi:transposase InsO family protein
MEILLPLCPTRSEPAEAKLNGSEAVGHITYVWTAEGWLYLAAILDLPFDRPRRAVSDMMTRRAA